MNNYIIDGRNIKDMQSLCGEFASAVNAPDGYFGKNFQSFDDCLFGGFGLEAPCKIVWKYSADSKKHLDCQMLEQYCEDILENNPEFHEPDFEEGKAWCLDTLKKAKLGERDFYDEIVDAISSVSERASFDYKVELVLE
ncbi:barstar family protein [Pleionea sediminis]|uniref:barstar family protein n=1 Tax=Pleionea sediminis TaxID=2569479 RepID=UPI0011858D83|nr:barstar family protein [Pleionea sediminis]